MEDALGRRNRLRKCTAVVPWWHAHAGVCAKSLQSCSTLCDPMDCSAPGSSVHGILQARILEQVAMPSSSGSPRPRDRTASLTSPVLAGGFFTTRATWEAPIYMWSCRNAEFSFLLPVHGQIYLFFILIYWFVCAGFWLWHTGFLIFIATCGILGCSMWDLVSWPGIKHGPLHWELGVLATGPLGKSHWSDL